MISIMHMPWIGRELEVIGSFDPTYVGRKGLVVEETQRTLTINEEGRILYCFRRSPSISSPFHRSSSHK